MSFQTLTQKRITIYILLFIALTLLYNWLLNSTSTWQTTKEFQIVLKTIAAVLAFIIASIILAHYYIYKNYNNLLVSMIFFGIACKTFIPIPTLFLISGFIYALLVYLIQEKWKQDDCEHWLIMSIIIGLMGELGELFDLNLNITLMIKDISYIFLFIGLLIIMHAMIKKYENIAKEADDVAEKVAYFYAKLQVVVKECEKAEKTAEAANRAKSEFLANMSHEIRTPLNAILGFAQILIHDKSLPKQHKNSINTIRQAGEHLLLLLNDILDMSKIEAGQMEINLKEFLFQHFLQEVVDIINISAQQKGIHLISDFQSDLPLVTRTDERRLRQVLINLLGNAVKFTEKGFVKFTVSQNSANKIRFQIEDSGIGIAANDLDKIFEAFKQVGSNQKKYEGTGLGLPLSKKLVEMMGGSLQVTSTLGKGSIFWFDLTLPKIRDSQSLNPPTKLEIIGFKGKKKKILLIEDSKTNLAVFKNLLSPLGFEIIQATNGQQGVKTALAEQPDLILMDLVMPVIDGLTATRLIRESGKLPNVVIIAISASYFNNLRQQSLDAGCDYFLIKPIQHDELFDILQKSLKLEWVIENEISDSEQTEQPLIPPPINVTKKLYDLAMKGNVDGIIQEAKKLEQANDKFQVFVTKLLKLAENFQVRKIREFIKPYLNRSQS